MNKSGAENKRKSLNKEKPPRYFKNAHNPKILSTVKETPQNSTVKTPNKPILF
jgi:hypothetical protein